MLEIIQDVRKVSDKWYAACEMMVRVIDSQCKALDNDKISRKSLCQIIEFIKQINEETSNINNNFELRIDSGNKNDVGSISYATSIEALAIQKEWEMKLALYVESDEEKAVREAEEQIKQKKLEVELAETSQKEKALREEQEAWEKEVERLEQKIKESRIAEKEKLDLKYKQLSDELDAKQKSDESKIEEEIKGFKESKVSLENEINNLSIFSISKKNALRKEIELIQQKINACNQKFPEIRVGCERKKIELQASKKKQYMEICEKIETKTVFPISPVERERKKQREKDKILLLKTLKEIRSGTHSEIHGSNDELAEMSRGRITSMLQELMTEGKVSRTIEGRQTTFWFEGPIIEENDAGAVDYSGVDLYLVERGGKVASDDELMEIARDKSLIAGILEKIGQGTRTEIRMMNSNLEKYNSMKMTSLLNRLEEDGRIRKKTVGGKIIYEFVG